MAKSCTTSYEDQASDTAPEPFRPSAAQYRAIPGAAADAAAHIDYLFFINCYIPMFGLFIAFKNINYIDGIMGSPWAGLDNFRFLFATSDALRVTINTVGYNVVFIISGLILSVSLAIAINEVRGKLASKFFQTVMIMPNFLSMVVVSFIVYAFLHPEYGFLVKHILPMFGYSSVNAYMHPNAWPYILWITKMWHSIGIGSVIYLAAITGISEELYEAAVMDGASKWKQITKITPAAAYADHGDSHDS
ncbi:ABC transporter permease subunit [Paenibacillus rhizoplanae]